MYINIYSYTYIYVYIHVCIYIFLFKSPPSAEKGEPPGGDGVNQSNPVKITGNSQESEEKRVGKQRG